MGELTETQQKTVDTINKMGQEEMARLWRFAPSGHPYFDRTLPYYEYFQARFEGFTPEISKSIGLNPHL